MDTVNTFIIYLFTYLLFVWNKIVPKFISLK